MQPSILTKFLPKTEEKKDYFLTLEIQDDQIKTAACEIKKGEVEILGLGAASYQGGWEEATVATDEAIAQVEPKFLPEISVDKVILGLPTEYTKDGKIEETRLLWIRELLAKLSLTPLGFVEIPLAMIYLLQKQEGGPQTLILVRVGKDLTVSLVRVGKITNHLSFVRTDNLVSDLEKALTSFEAPVLPSRILLYNGQAEPDLEKVRQDLMNHPWLTKASFLHFPKIETAPPDLDIKAIAFAGASEMAQVVEMTEAEPRQEPAESSDFGFVKEEDILEKEERQLSAPAPEFVPVVQSQPSTQAPPVKFHLPKISLPRLPSLEKVKALLAQKKGLTILAAMFLFIFVGLALAAGYWYLPKVQVNLTLESQTLSQTIEATINPKLTTIEEAKKEIPGLTFEIEERETKKAATTSKKTVGEQAKGEVVIYNKTTNSKTFKKGTILVGSNNLKFTLDDEITVASASENVGSLTFGKQNARLTAEAIGPEGNLGVGQDFNLADFPTTSYSARNDVAFSGGTSREISVVGRNDQEKLAASASMELTVMAKKDLTAKLGNGEKILDKTLAGTVTQKKFNKEVDEEATELSLDMTMHFTASGFREEDLLTLLEKIMTTSIPTGFEVKRSEISMEIVSLEKKKDETTSVKANFTIPLFPKINEAEVKKNLVGKSLTGANNYLHNLGNIAGYEIRNLRTFPLGQGTLPHLSRNIIIKTQGR